MTADKDFGELVFRLGRASHGVVLLRMGEVTPEATADILCGLLADRADELPAAFTVISPGQVRVRPRPSPPG